jgi:hypothetical protein
MILMPILEATKHMAGLGYRVYSDIEHLRLAILPLPYGERLEKNGRKTDGKKYGRLDLGNIEFKGSEYNAFLLNCALSAVVPEPDEKRETYDKCMKDKQKLASIFLVKN